jgi:ketosteroid isomerase-like protein
MPRQSGHRYIDIIKRYYEGCNSADYDLLMSTFTDDIVHYFVDHGAVHGADGLANYWVKVAPRTKARWTLDHAIVEEPEAVIEWSMKWTPPATGKPELLRGSEWYLFRDDKIAEIRSYHNNIHLQNPKNAELWDFDYEGRGYTLRDAG